MVCATVFGLLRHRITNALAFAGQSPTMVIGRNVPPFVILGRSRSEAEAQTLGSTPYRRRHAPAMQKLRIPTAFGAETAWKQGTVYFLSAEKR
jgi:hypothetical protein